MISIVFTGAWRRLLAPAALAAGLALAGCGGPVSEALPGNGQVANRLGNVFEPRRRELPPPDPSQQALGEIPYCPDAQILDGTELHRVYARGMEGEDQAIILQASVAETARECSYDPNVTQVTMKVGVAGRAILGPRGAAGSFELPLRIAVLGPGDKPVFSEIARVPVTILPGETSAPFNHVRDAITVPLAAPAEIYGYRIYVGFDDMTRDRRR